MSVGGHDGKKREAEAPFRQSGNHGMLVGRLPEGVGVDQDLRTESGEAN